ncbi:hypothetical protein LUZ60_016836 [Juncus effusus]|nr:hypothetical protein LUZ60_016836 [Juncus effusus]
MAEIVAGIVVAEAISVLFKGVKSYVLKRYLDRTGVQKKLDRLNMLVIKINTALELSMKFDIKTDSSLWRWNEELKKAVIEGEDILNKFKDQAGSGSSSFASSFTKTIFPDDNINKLDNIVEKLEGISVGNFTELLKMEIFNFASSFIELSEVPKVLYKRAIQPDEQAASAYLRSARFPRNKPQVLVPHSSEAKFLSISPHKAAQVSSDSVVVKESQPEPITSKWHLSQIELEADILKPLVAQIKDVIDNAKWHTVDHGPYLVKWMEKLEAAVEEGECVLSAIKSLNYNDTVCTEEVLNDALTIFTGVRERLEKMNGDAKDFLELVKLANKVVDLARATGSNAQSQMKQVATGKRPRSESSDSDSSLKS